MSRPRSFVRFSLAAVLCAVGLLAGPAAADHLLAPMPDTESPVLSPLEHHVRMSTLDGWDVALFSPEGNLYKGMDPSCDKIMSNDDIKNRFAQTPSWYGNVSVARAYAIRSTAKVYQTQLKRVDGRPFSELADFDPAVASIAIFKPRRELRLFSLIDRSNLDKLLAAIEAKMKKQLDTPIGRWIAKNPSVWLGVELMDDEALTEQQLLEKIHVLGKPQGRQRVDDAMAEMVRHNRDSIVPFGLTQDQMTYMIEALTAKRMNSDGEEWAQELAIKQALRKNRRAAGKVIDELVRLQRQWYALRFATGYHMTWDEQRKILGAARVAARQLTTVGDFSGERMSHAYDENLDLQPGHIVATFGPAYDHFNRISMMDKDLEVLNVIKEYVNVDGYWAPPVPSLWHRDQHFHSEMALFHPKSTVEFTGKCVQANELPTNLPRDRDVGEEADASWGSGE